MLKNLCPSRYAEQEEVQDPVKVLPPTAIRQLLAILAAPILLNLCNASLVGHVHQSLA